MWQGYQTQLTLLDLLFRTWTFECHDPRDKMYSLLGLIGPDKDTLRLYSDYMKPAPELYAQVTKHIIREQGNWNFLTHNHDASFRKLSTLPSWVPDFSVSGVNDMYHNLFDAAGKRLKQFRCPSTSWERLGVTGIRWDTVVQMGDKNKGTNSQFDFDPTWYEIAMQLDRVYATDQHRTEALWRTLCMNQDVLGNYPAPDEFKDQFHELVSGIICAQGEREAAKMADTTRLSFTFLEAMLELQTPQKSRLPLIFARAVHEMREPPNPGIQGPYFDSLKPTLALLDELAKTDSQCITPTSNQIEEFRKNSEWRLWKKDGQLDNSKNDAYMLAFASRYARRRLIRTGKNFLGLGPVSMEVGDEIWILAGTCMPFILRKSDTGRYRLVGVAYVHGIMHGEAVRDEDLNLMDIELE